MNTNDTLLNPIIITSATEIQHLTKFINTIILAGKKAKKYNKCTVVQGAYKAATSADALLWAQKTANAIEYFTEYRAHDTFAPILIVDDKDSSKIFLCYILNTTAEDRDKINSATDHVLGEYPHVTVP